VVMAWTDWSRELDDDKAMVGSFKNKTWTQVPMPQAMPQSKKEKPILGLGVLDGCLALAFCTDCIRLHEIEVEVEVFVMKKYGDQGSWTSLFVIPNIGMGLSHCRIWVPLCFAKNIAEVLVSPPNNNWEEEEEYTEIFLSGLTKKYWKREQGDVAFKSFVFMAESTFGISVEIFICSLCGFGLLKPDLLEVPSFLIVLYEMFSDLDLIS
ncbi:hypothetical protein C3L33_23066, partial [Rhododendron williamsianum]